MIVTVVVFAVTVVTGFAIPFQEITYDPAEPLTVTPAYPESAVIADWICEEVG